MDRRVDQIPQKENINEHKEKRNIPSGKQMGDEVEK